MSIKQIVGDDRYEKMRGALKACFPDPATVVSDAAVDTAFQVAKFEWKAADLQALAIPSPAAPAVAAGAGQFEYYVAHATHARVAAPYSAFTGHLPLVRFQLPDHGTTQTLPTLHTRGGDILPVDRLNASIDVLWATYKNEPELQRPERVDMITPPRLDGARFAAISLYLCFKRKTDTAPAFYILEAGLATGQARMPFLGRTMESEIVAQTQYKPTSFSEPYHFYRGKLTMYAAAPSEPHSLSVKVYQRPPAAFGQPPSGEYIDVTVVYEKRPNPKLTNPFHLTIAAGARVQAIADVLGISPHLEQAWFLRLLAALDMDNLFSVPPHRSPNPHA
jgi:hypothetical protein